MNATRTDSIEVVLSFEQANRLAYLLRNQEPAMAAILRHELNKGRSMKVLR